MKEINTKIIFIDNSECLAAKIKIRAQENKIY